MLSFNCNSEMDRQVDVARSSEVILFLAPDGPRALPCPNQHLMLGHFRPWVDFAMEFNLP